MAEYKQIETERLRIVPFLEEHLTERYVSWLNDPEVVKFSEQRHLRHSLESCRAYYQFVNNSDNDFLAICYKSNGLHIGNATVTTDVHNGIADVSIMIGDRMFWGEGLGAEAFSAIVENLLQRSGIRKVTAGTMVENKPMLKAMALAGMKEESRRIGHYMLNGRPINIVYYARWRNDANI